MAMNRKINFNDNDDEDLSLYNMQAEFNEKFYNLIRSQFEGFESTFDQTQDILKTLKAEQPELPPTSCNF